MKKLAFFFTLSFLLSLTACDRNNNFTLFSIENDLSLGQEVSAQIENDPQFDILSRAEAPAAYAYLDSVVSSILNTGEVAYRDDFVWEVKIIEDDNTLNAFATPGGYIYVYTGLIKFLDNADAFAGVVGHEIAHADLRHTSRILQRQYGVSLLLQIISGESESELANIAAQIAGNAAGLSFSREFETESDEKSVVYLGATGFACDGAKLFFQKLESQGQGSTVPEFLSTHPSPENRIENIEAKAAEENCDTEPSSLTPYQQFQQDLP
jgi:predicted Zn-dependent protease